MVAKKNGQNITPSDFAADISHFWANTAWMRYPWPSVAGKSMMAVNNIDEERLTLDFNLHFNWEDAHHKFENLVIAELKQSKLTRNSPFYQLMKANHIRPYRLSKWAKSLRNSPSD